MKLEELNRHAGIHAAGVVIGEKPLSEYNQGRRCLRDCGRRVPQ
jgi:DNA polymerase III alpha subunit